MKNNLPRCHHKLSVLMIQTANRALRADFESAVMQAIEE